MAIGPRGTQAAVVSGIFTALGTLFCVLRLWTRLVIIRAVGYEDVLLLLSWACALTTTIFTGSQIHYGLGEHAATLSQSQLQNLQFCVYISITTYCASIGLTKIAILLQYQRVFPARKFQTWCWSFIAIVVSFTTAMVLTSIFSCTPIERFWTGVEGRCVNKVASWFSNSALNVVTDLMIIILPMPVVRSLKLAKRQKWLLMGVFAFGGVVCIISIVRLQSLLIMAKTKDPSYDNATIVTYSIVEINVALICACLPTLKPLIAPWFSGLSNTSRGTNGSSGGFTSHGQKRSSVMPTVGTYSMGLSTLSKKRGTERLDGDSDSYDQIRVETRIDVKAEKETAVQEGSHKSTESLVRDVHNIV